MRCNILNKYSNKYIFPGGFGDQNESNPGGRVLPTPYYVRRVGGLRMYLKGRAGCIPGRGAGFAGRGGRGVIRGRGVIVRGVLIPARGGRGAPRGGRVLLELNEFKLTINKQHTAISNL